MKTKLLIFLITLLPFLQSTASDTLFLGAKEPYSIYGQYDFYAGRLTGGIDKQKLHTGGFTGSLIFGQDTLKSADIRSGFLGVTDSLDQWMWYKKIDGQGFNQVNAALEYQNGWIVAGVFSDTIQLGNTMMISQAYQNVFLAYVNNQGEIISSQQINLTPAGGKQFLQKGHNNSILFGAEFTGQFLHGDSTYLSQGTRNVLIAKLNTTGDIEEIAIASSRAALDLRVFESLPGGKLLVGVGYSDTLHFGDHTLANSGASDFVLARFSRNLNLEQFKTSSGGGEKTIKGATRHPGGFVFFGEYSGEFTWDDHNFPQENGRHIFMIKLVGNGNLVWKQSLNGYSQKNAVDIVPGDQNHLYLLANFRGSMTLFDQEYVTEDFNYQWFIARFSPSGDFQWLEFAENEENLFASVFAGTEPGKLSLLGVNRFSSPSLFNHALDSIGRGLFYMDLLDCEFAKKPGLPEDTVFCGPGVLFADDEYASALWNNTTESLTYLVETTGWVHVELTDRFGCIVYDTLFVEVLPPFDIEITGHENICPNGGITILTVDTDADVTWSTGETGNQLFVQETGEYYAQAVNIHGCQAEDSFIVANFELQPPLLNEYYMIDSYDTLELFPGEYAAYSWSDGQNGAIFTIYGQDFGEGTYNYSVELTDYNACVQQFDFMVDIFDAQTSSGEVANDPPSGYETTSTINLADGLIKIINQGEECNFILYPNPGKEAIYLTDITIPYEMYDKNRLNIEYFIFGSRGELVSKQEKDHHTLPWKISEVESLSPGTYHFALLINKKLCTVNNLIILP